MAAHDFWTLSRYLRILMALEVIEVKVASEKASEIECIIWVRVREM